MCSDPLQGNGIGLVGMFRERGRVPGRMPLGVAKPVVLQGFSPRWGSVQSASHAPTMVRV